MNASPLSLDRVSYAQYRFLRFWRKVEKTSDMDDMSPRHIQLTRKLLWRQLFQIQGPAASPASRRLDSGEGS